MAFVKLDCGMLDSSLWINPDLTRVFITVLLMSKPIEYEQSTVTFQLDSNEPAEFVIPPGRYGLAPAASPGIVLRTNIGEDRAMKALQALMNPDPASRTPDYDGRRIARVSGGFVVLNYDLYRIKDHTASARSQRYRDNKAGRTATRDTVTHTRDERDAS